MTSPLADASAHEETMILSATLNDYAATGEQNRNFYLIFGNFVATGYGNIINSIKLRPAVYSYLFAFCSTYETYSVIYNIFRHNMHQYS